MDGGCSLLQEPLEGVEEQGGPVEAGVRVAKHRGPLASSFDPGGIKPSRVLLDLSLRPVFNFNFILIGLIRADALIHV